ncbi:hypothetical protein HN419_01965 [Candidatus Woesearchaeota archaeon]|jgi:hypothetical protein|nr:hypothetical protein [Candidatus Woesearchaeota archaeon]MBT3537237.1 hypothetical protein [Candidatus Woesearchaeota archaeon]MBT4696787.1 hypothetical protein [Candidatus Woesearchaeota archaeon]MBT7106453.1 hypothetical protein [Candidatus Woesearchaeota archaeon]MBT7931172.1 hypothetical protein [Candidatus Woesearchaeota archaeon]
MYYKKADAQILFKLIAIVALMLVLIGMGYTVYMWLQGLTDLQRCRVNVLAVSAIKDVSLGIANVNIDCPMEEMEINKKMIENSDGDITARIVMGSVADQFRRCWFKMGEGVNPFSGPIWSEIASDMATSCVFCSHVTYDDDVILDYKAETGSSVITLDMMVNFLNSQPYGKTDYTYGQYFSRSGHNVAELFYSTTTIDVAKPFYIVYRYISPANLWKAASAINSAMGLESNAEFSKTQGKKRPSMFIYQSNDLVSSGCKRIMN